MNIEIANRLVDLRKKSGLSQEELAAKLGLSRQAVSKWERAEASPDTDNLICLAKLYGVSLDDLLNTNQSVDEIVREQVKKDDAGETKESPKDDASASNNDGKGQNTGETASMHSDGTTGESKFEGSYYDEDKQKEVHVEGGIHVTGSDGARVDIGKDGIHVTGANGEEKTVNHVHWGVTRSRKKHFETISAIASGITTMLAVIAYLLCGFLIPNAYYGWGCSWIVFFLIPLVPSFVDALAKRSFCTFAFPVLVTAAYLFCGMVYQLWNPTWILFLAIPLYYIAFGPIDKVIRKHHPEDYEIRTDEDDKTDDDVIDVDVK
jgi:transcriptional regulator with XRE-family HTH domain